jgi:hypothetical protein
LEDAALLVDRNYVVVEKTTHKRASVSLGSPPSKYPADSLLLLFLVAREKMISIRISGQKVGGVVGKWIDRLIGR